MTSLEGHGAIIVNWFARWIYLGVKHPKNYVEEMMKRCDPVALEVIKANKLDEKLIDNSLPDYKF